MKRVILLCIALMNFCAFAEHLEMSFIERPPHIYVNADGSIRGNMGRQMQEVFDRAKIDISWLRYRPKELNKLLEEDSFEAFVATHNVVKNWDDFYFSDKPVVILQFYFYNLANTKQPSSLADTHNSTVAIPLSINVLQGPLKKWLTTPEHNIQVIADVQNLEQAVPLLRTKVIDYYFSYISPDTISMRFSSVLSERELLTTEAYSSPMHLIVRKTVPNAKRIVAKVDQAIGD